MVIGIYKNKLVLFVFLGLLVFFTNKYADFSSPVASADRAVADIADNVNMSSNSNRFYLELDMQSDGSIEIDGERISESIKPYANFDELRYMILDKPQELYSKLEIVLILPKSLTKVDRAPEIIAVHGADPIGATLYGDRIVYQAENIGSSATITITAAFPKGYIDLNADKKIEETVGAIPATYWIAISLILPLIAVIILLSIIRRTRVGFLGREPVGKLKRPPEQLPPAVVGALIDGKVGPRSIMATLVDLAQRDYIEIYNRGDDFVIFKKRFDPKIANLRKFEEVLMDKIFMPKQKVVGSFDVETRVARHLFSRKIALSYLEIYDEGRARGYFSDAPARTHLRYRMIGILIFYIGLLGYLISALFAADPKFVLLFWVSLVIFGILIVNLSPNITSLSSRGVEFRDKWLRFKNYLVDKTPIESEQEDLFEKYLPYAIAMGVEGDWASRFIEQRFAKPDWYDYVTDINGVENFTKSFLPIIDYIAKAFDSSSDPLVK